MADNFVDRAVATARHEAQHQQSIPHSAAWYPQPDEESWGRCNKGLVDRLSARVDLLEADVAQLKADAVTEQVKLTWLETELKRLATKVGIMEGADEERCVPATVEQPEEWVPEGQSWEAHALAARIADLERRMDEADEGFAKLQEQAIARARR